MTLTLSITLLNRFGHAFQKHSLLTHRRDELGQIGTRRYEETGRFE